MVYSCSGILFSYKKEYNIGTWYIKEPWKYYTSWKWPNAKLSPKLYSRKMHRISKFYRDREQISDYQKLGEICFGGGSVLELGCGDGHTLYEYTKNC
jgi:hypothetical protein